MAANTDDLVRGALRAAGAAAARGQHIPVSHRAVLMALAALADERAVVEVSGRELAVLVGLNDQTTREIMRSLRAAGLLRLLRVGHGTRSNRYQVVTQVVTHGGPADQVGEPESASL